MTIRHLVCFALLIFGAAMPAHACSVAAGYRIPTTLELVEGADTIMLAGVAEGKPYAEAAGITTARLIPVTLLKGASLPTDVPIENAFLSNAQIKATASDPRNLVDANPDAFSGACNRYVFDRDMMLLVFLERQDGKLRVMAPPFSRALEDVASPDALWVKAVKLYIDIAARPRSERRSAMESRQAALQIDIDDPDARLLALELERALHDPR